MPSSNFQCPALSDPTPVPWATFKKACAFLLPGLLLLGGVGHSSRSGALVRDRALLSGPWGKMGAGFKSKMDITQPSQN